MAGQDRKKARKFIVVILVFLVLGFVAASFFGTGDRSVAPPVTTGLIGPATSELPSTHVHDLAIPRNDVPILEVATHRGLYESTDEGHSFTAIAGEFPSADMTVLAFDPVSRDIVYGGGRNLRSVSAGLVRSSDAGLSWQTVYSGAIPTAIAIDPDDPSRVLMATTEKILQSTNYGVSWDAVSVPVDPGEVTSISITKGETTSHFISGPEIGLRVSGDDLDDWKEITHNVLDGNTTVIEASSGVGGLLWAGGQHIVLSDDYGVTWKSSREGAPTDIVAIASSVNESRILFAAAGDPARIVISTDNGETWETP